MLIHPKNLLNLKKKNKIKHKKAKKNYKQKNPDKFRAKQTLLPKKLF